jgi:hypothetical protein
MNRLIERVFNVTLPPIIRALGGYSNMTRTIRWERWQRAAAESATYVDTHLPNVSPTTGRKALIDFAVRSVTTKGLFLEFGVFQGDSINRVSKHVPGPVWGFDSFVGLPESWEGMHDPGHFKVAKLPRVRSNVRLVQGWFNETLPKFLSEHPEPVAFLHVDCDLYSSTKTILDLLKPRLQAGTVILFDDYFSYPGWQQGEHKAWTEFVTAHNIRYHFTGYNDLGQQACVVVDSIS